VALSASHTCCTAPHGRAKLTTDPISNHERFGRQAPNYFALSSTNLLISTLNSALSPHSTSRWPSSTDTYSTQDCTEHERTLLSCIQHDEVEDSQNWSGVAHLSPPRVIHVPARWVITHPVTILQRPRLLTSLQQPSLPVHLLGQSLHSAPQAIPFPLLSDHKTCASINSKPLQHLNMALATRKHANWGNPRKSQFNAGPQIRSTWRNLTHVEVPGLMKEKRKKIITNAIYDQAGGADL
jgi:hypothetical protein